MYALRQATFAESGFAKFHRPTRKDRFLAQMEELIPWRELRISVRKSRVNSVGLKHARYWPHSSNLLSCKWPNWSRHE